MFNSGIYLTVRRFIIYNMEVNRCIYTHSFNNSYIENLYYRLFILTHFTILLYGILIMFEICRANSQAQIKKVKNRCVDTREKIWNSWDSSATKPYQLATRSCIESSVELPRFQLGSDTVRLFASSSNY